MTQEIGVSNSRNNAHCSFSYILGLEVRLVPRMNWGLITWERCLQFNYRRTNNGEAFHAFRVGGQPVTLDAGFFEWHLYDQVSA